MSGIIYAIERACSNMSFIDALYMSASGMTLTGLNSKNLPDLCWATQFILLLEMILGWYRSHDCSSLECW